MMIFHTKKREKRQRKENKEKFTNAQYKICIIRHICKSRQKTVEIGMRNVILITDVLKQIHFLRHVVRLSSAFQRNA